MIYNGFATVYDSLMTDTPYDFWFQELLKTFKKYNLKGKDILDLACGTGAMSLRLSKHGYKVLGVDLSEEMLEVAQSKAFENNLKARFVQQDMTDLELFHPYDSIISYCDGFNYLLEIEQLKRVFDHALSYLKDDGLFVFDISSDYKLKTVLGQNIITESNEAPFIWENYYNEATKILEFDLTLFVQEGSLYKRYEEVHKQRAYSKEEILETMISCGFEPLEVLDTNTGLEVTSTSERWLFIGRKINE